LFLLNSIGSAQESEWARISGVWMTTTNTAVLKISVKNGAPLLEEWSAWSGKKLVISDYAWDGKILNFSSYFPDTRHRASFRLELIDNDTLSGKRFGDIPGDVTWKRK
jgi:hypothetical protein